MKWFKVAAVGIGVALLATTAANAAPAGHLQPLNPHVSLVPAAAVDTATESKYTAIAPCRIADTRVAGGAVTSGHARSFYALGDTGFGAQGGSACDIPTSATAVTGSIIGVDATANGYVKAFAYGASIPAASFLNYSKTATLSASGTIPVANGTRNFTVVTSGGTVHLVIQLTGYFVPPMFAYVNAIGAALMSSRVVSTTHPEPGEYQVDFDRDVSNCVYTANSVDYGITVSVQPRIGDTHGVFVRNSDYNGDPADSYFYLTVTC